MVERAKFCRFCGAASGSIEDATTRSLDAPSVSAATEPVRAAPTAPSYVEPIQPQYAAPYTTQGLQRPGRMLWILLLAFVLIAAVGFAAVAVYFATAERDVVVVAPPSPEAPAIPELPPLPPAPPPPPVAHEGAISRSLFYPGAEVVLDVNRAHEGGLVQLRTGDDPDRVAAWYRSRIAPTKDINLPGVGTVLGNSEITVVIAGSPAGTSIVIKEGSDE